MPITISYDEWRRRTFSRTAPRSTALKELDEAIRIRHEPAAKKALIEWIKAHNKKGKDWHTSVRNKDGVVEALYKELGILGSEVSYANTDQERDDKLAKEFIKKEQRLAKQKLFEGKKLKWKSSFTGVHKAKSDSAKHKLEARLKTAKGLKGHYDTVESTRKNILTIIDGITGNLPKAEASELIKKVFGAEAAEFAMMISHEMMSDPISSLATPPFADNACFSACCIANIKAPKTVKNCDMSAKP